MARTVSVIVRTDSLLQPFVSLSETAFRALAQKLWSEQADIDYTNSMVPAGIEGKAWLYAVSFERLSHPSGELVAQIVHEPPRYVDMRRLTGCSLLHGDMFAEPRPN